MLSTTSSNSPNKLNVALPLIIAFLIILFSVFIVLFVENMFNYSPLPYSQERYIQSNTILDTGHVAHDYNSNNYSIVKHVEWKSFVPGVPMFATEVKILGNIDVIYIYKYLGIPLYIYAIYLLYKLYNEITRVSLLSLILAASVGLFPFFILAFADFRNATLLWPLMILLFNCLYNINVNNNIKVKNIAMLIIIILVFLVTYRTMSYVIITTVIAYWITNVERRDIIIKFALPIHILFTINVLENKIFFTGIRDILGVPTVIFEILLCFFCVSPIFFHLAFNHYKSLIFKLKFKFCRKNGEFLLRTVTTLSRGKMLYFLILFSFAILYILPKILRYTIHTFAYEYICVIYIILVSLYFGLILHLINLYLRARCIGWNTRDSNVQFMKFIIITVLILATLFMLTREAGRFLNFLPFLTVTLLSLSIKSKLANMKNIKIILSLIFVTCIVTNITLYTSEQGPYYAHTPKEEMYGLSQFVVGHVPVEETILTSFDVGSELTIRGHINTTIADDILQKYKWQYELLASSDDDSISTLYDRDVKYIIIDSNWNKYFRTFECSRSGINLEVIRTKFSKHPLSNDIYASDSFNIYYLK